MSLVTARAFVIRHLSLHAINACPIAIRAFSDYASAMTATVLRWTASILLFITAVIAAIQLSSSSWPGVQGTVLRGGWPSQRSFSNDNRNYEVTYTYDVSGKNYRGNRIGWAAITSIVLVHNGKDGKPEERQPRENDIVTVHHAPWLPSLAVLVPGPSPRLWIWSIVSALFAIILFAFAKLSTHPIY